MAAMNDKSGTAIIMGNQIIEYHKGEPVVFYQNASGDLVEFPKRNAGAAFEPPLITPGRSWTKRRLRHDN